jgi:hypothetical protein
MRGSLWLAYASALLLAASPMACAGGGDSTAFVPADATVDATTDASPGMDATRDARGDGPSMADGTAMDVADATTPPMDGGIDGSDATGAGDGPMDAAQDGGSPEAAMDAGTDAAVDAAMDAAADAAPDAAPDAAADAGSCSESPCKLVSPQCGCPPGAECAVNGMGRFCAVAGSVGAGAVCSAAMPCAPGLACVFLSPTVSTCNVFCSADSQCTAPGGLCLVTLSNGMDGGSIPNVTLCTENCDLLTSTGCAAGLSCQVGQEAAGQMRFFTQCTGAGAGLEGAACTTSADCARDFACVNNGVSNVCLQYCDVNAPACGALTCFQLVDAAMAPFVIGNMSVGVCQ